MRADLAKRGATLLFTGLQLCLSIASVQLGDPLTDPFCRTDYRNQIFTDVPTNVPGTSLGQTAAIAIWSGGLGDGTNSLTSLRTNTPNDGQIYLTQSIIAQPVGVVVVPFDISVQGVGTASPTPATDWFQLGQFVCLTARPGRYYEFSHWSDGVALNPRQVVVGHGNSYIAYFTNQLALETNVVAGGARVAPVATPLLLLDGRYYPADIVLATNGQSFQAQFQTTYPAGKVRYTTDGSDPTAGNLYTGAVTVLAPFSIRAVAFRQDNTDPVYADAVNTLSATTPGKGTIVAALQTDLYTGANSAVLTATPDTGWTFLSWTGDASSPSTSLTLAVDGPKAVQGSFGTPIMLGTDGSGSGLVLASPAQPFHAYGSTVRLSAIPNPDSYFASWGGALGGSESNPAELIVTSLYPTNKATFGKLGNDTSALTVLINGEGTVTKEPTAAYYSNGVSVTVTAVASSNQSFISWSGDVPGTNNPLSIVVTTNRVITANFAPTQPVFRFASATYEVNENAGAVFLMVSNLGTLGGSVEWATLDGTAVGADGEAGDYVATTNTLTFAAGEQAKTLSVAIRDQFLVAADKYFKVRLANPSPGSIVNPKEATVTIHYNDAVATNGPMLVQAFPGPVPNRSASLRVTVREPVPSVMGGFWRFPWELAWRDSGALVTNLLADYYDVVFRPIGGYDVADFIAQPVLANVGTTEVTNSYSTNALTGCGQLTVNIGPYNPWLQANAKWRMLGDTNWLTSDVTLTNLTPAENYLVEFKPVLNFVAPATREVAVFADQESLITNYYSIPTSLPTNVSLPTVLPSLDYIVNSVTNNPRLPFAFNGQVKADVGFGSGVAVLDRVVLTAAHLVFDDLTLSYVGNVSWFFQKQAGELDPKPLSARGWYVLSGYAAARTNDLRWCYPGQSSPESRRWDVAALYFTSLSARGGYGGLLSSDAATNEWLTSDAPRLLVGYPMDASAYSYTNIAPGRMHATAISNYMFRPLSDRVYSSPSLFGFPGSSGGPLYILHTNNIFYPVAVYLGILHDTVLDRDISVVRAIDGEVVNLVNLARSSATFGDSGTNFTGGGVIRIVPIQGSGSLAYIKVRITPSGAISAGAGWRLQGTSSGYHNNPEDVETIASGSTAVVEFRIVDGWDGPTDRTAYVKLGQTTVIEARYTRSARLGVTPSGGFSASGFVGGPFSPASMNYTLTNRGEAALSWSVSKTADWLSLSASNGSLAAGAKTSITVNLNANANALPPGNYSGTVNFTNSTTGLGSTNFVVSLSVAVRSPVILAEPQLLTNGRIAMTLRGVTNRVYSILGTTNLLQPLTNWSEVLRLTNTAGQTRFTNPPASVSPQFYRAREL